jgi:hypothetical protein
VLESFLWRAPEWVLPLLRVPGSSEGAQCSKTRLWVRLRELFVPLWILLRVGRLGSDLI